MRIVFFIFFILHFLYADIVLKGYLHPGDNEFSGYRPLDPLTNDFEATYDYYTNNPTLFYLSSPVTLSGIELQDVVGIASDSNIRVWIDGRLVATGSDGSGNVSFSLQLSQGFHTIAVTGSCYDNGNEVDCTDRRVDDIDDFYFSAIRLLTADTTTAYNFIERHHAGDDDDNNDNYDIDDEDYQYYPDSVEGGEISYTINYNAKLDSFRIYITRMRDIHVDGVNKVLVYDSNDNLITSFDINHSTTLPFDMDLFYKSASGSIDGVSRVVVVGGNYTSTARDDISWDDLVFIPDPPIAKPIVEYRMDECGWDSDDTTYEIKNSGSLGDEANATAVNNAYNDSGGVLCRLGDFRQTRQITPKSAVKLPKGRSHTITLWIDFPLDSTDHVTYREGFGWNRINVQYYNIADRKGSLESFIFFKKDLTNDRWYVCVDDDDGYPHCEAFTMPTERTHIAFVIDHMKEETRVYKNGTLDVTIDYAIGGSVDIDLNRFFASDYNDNIDGQTLGAKADEFKIFVGVLQEQQIAAIYNNEKSGKNYDGTTRSCQNCVGLNLLLDYHMDECSWDSDDTTYEVINYSSLGSDYDATPLFGALRVDGKVCGGGDFRGSIDSDVAMIGKNGLTLPDVMTLNVWVKFPLDTSNHLPFSSRYNFFNIADRVGSDNDFIWFTYDINNDSWYLCVKGVNTECQSFNPQSLSGWHMLTFRMDGSSTEFLLDANSELTFNQSPTGGTLGLLFNSDYDAGDNESNGQSLGAVADEFRLYEGLLGDNDINDLLTLSRVCPNCNRNYKFDAWDTFRDEYDKNISTKVVNQRFALTLAEINETEYKDDFNGTVCVTIYDAGTLKRVSEWNATYWQKGDDVNTTTIEFNVAQALKEAKVYIYWKEDVYESNDSCDNLFGHEENETNASDNFAIRPKEFNITYGGELYAGEWIDINFSAWDWSGDETIDYNETNGSSFEINISLTKPSCIFGSVEFNDSLEFEDGKLERKFRYGEVGEINVSITEYECAKRFAAVDCKDKNVTGYWNSDENTTIEANWTIITLAPWELNVTDMKFINSFGADWLYMAQEMNETNVTLKVTVSAYNKQGAETKDYNETCYGLENVTLEFLFDVNNTASISQNDIDVSYKNVLHSDVEVHTKLSEINVSYDITTAMFIDGNATSIWVFEIDKNISQPLSPIFVKLDDVNISGSSAKYENNASNTGEITVDMNTTFYYARFLTQDILTDQIESATQAKVLVFSEENSIYVQDFNETLLDWYLFTEHNDTLYGQILEANASFSTSLQESTNDLSIDADYLQPAVFEINVTNNATPPLKNGYIHLNISPWLWYVPVGFGEEYSYATDSTCLQHPCFLYTFVQESGRKVKSGDTQGVNLGDINVSGQERGIRIFR